MMRLAQAKSERAIAIVLRYGSLISTVIMAVGLGLALVAGRTHALAPYERVDLSLLLGNLVRFDPPAITALGLLLLLLTPIFRIVVAAISFALERDLKYFLISLGVLGVVLISIRLAMES